jgi:flagellar hook assembly protein FlgD
VVNDTLTYYVVALYGGVESSASNSVTVIVEGVANTDETLSPAAHILSISPNPFADLAVIHYNLSNPTRVQMQVYNLKGQLVRTLVDASQSKGEQLAVWEGCDDNGRHLASGIYFLRTKLEGKTCITRRLVLLR